jgi:leader peptidase (prepilin peptidase)/N-methyltransferase
VIELRTGQDVSLRCELADTYGRRFLGLMGRSRLDRGHGVLFAPGGAIHTAFMRFAIDAVFLAPDGEVLRVAERVPPWRVRAAGRGVRFVLELAGGEAARLALAPGARLHVHGRSGGWGAFRSVRASLEGTGRVKAIGGGGRAADLRGHPTAPRPRTLRPRPATVVLAAAGAGAAFARFGPGREAVEESFVACILVALAAIDLRRHVLPNGIVLPAIAALAALELAADPAAAWKSLLWALGAFGLFLALALAYPPGLGMGDVKLAFFLGLALGAGVVDAVLLGTAGAAIVGLTVLIRYGRAGRKVALPLGTFLAFGALVVLVAQGPP